MTELLKAFPVDHAGRRQLLHPDLNRLIQMQTAVRYLRFLRPVRVDHLELPALNLARQSGRWVPNVPTHPAHLIVSRLNPAENRWQAVADVDLPYNPGFAGEGLSQSMRVEEMQAFFEQAVATQIPHRIKLDGVETACLKVECDREHPVWPNHGECNGGPFNVPFGILAELRAFGQALAAPPIPEYHPKLSMGPMRPAAPAGMTVNTCNPCEIVFHGKALSVGFSLVRPLLTKLSWDWHGAGQTPANRLHFKRLQDTLGGLNGPSYITPHGNFVAQNMGGQVTIEDNRVAYRNVNTGCGIVIDAVFSITADSISLELEQYAEQEVAVLEGEAWRLLWNMRAGLTSVAATPVETEGRNGFVNLPALLAADAGGCLAVRLRQGAGAFHTESYREFETRSTAFVLARPDSATAPQLIPAGKSQATFVLAASDLLPVAPGLEDGLSAGLRRSWAAGFSAFRPEFGGFSNNAISTNCHVNQWVAFDFAAFTRPPADGPHPLELVKFSIARALLDGGGYGYHRCLYLDSDPILLAGAGRIFQIGADHEWLDRVSPGVSAAARRILSNFDENEGMILCRALSGNSGSYRWSSNAMDVIGFGHIDAYVNAWSFRALMNAAGLCEVIGDSALAKRCAEVAGALRQNYTRQLLNPKTGWIAGWRSRDGSLHDYGFIWINGIACAFGVMEEADTIRVLRCLEMQREGVFPEAGYLGLPLNLLPIAAEDHILGQMQGGLMPTYETYTDGAVSPFSAGYYIRALASHGFAVAAATLANRLEHGFADGKCHGPFGTGKEFTAWTGADSGYEGTFGPNSGPLYAIAVHRGMIQPPDPEWWFTPA